MGEIPDSLETNSHGVELTSQYTKADGPQDEASLADHVWCAAYSLSLSSFGISDPIVGFHPDNSSSNFPNEVDHSPAPAPSAICIVETDYLQERTRAEVSCTSVGTS